jgi:Predicted Peptidoglycan domain
MKFSVNASSSRELRNDMVSRDLTGSPYTSVPEEIRRSYPIETGSKEQPIRQEQIAVEPEFEFVPEEATMTTQQSQDPLQLAALKTVDFEARKDKQGNLQVYKLPAGDMGGNFEVAGINDRYHPEAFKRISSLPAEERAGAAAQYIKEYTSPFVSKLPNSIQPFAQDLAFNRGMGGATKYIQQGLNSLGVNVSVDGKLGQQTLAAINKVQPQALMRATSDAQLQDEYRMANKNPARKPLLRGLENRIRNRLALLGSV